RFMDAEGDDKNLWSDVIVNTATTDLLIDVAEKHPQSMNNPRFAQAYFQSLADNGTLASKGKIYGDVAMETSDTTLLREYARSARDNGYTPAARNAYGILARMYPEDMVILREVGTLAFGQADYVGAEHYLSQY